MHGKTRLNPVGSFLLQLVVASLVLEVSWACSWSGGGGGYKPTPKPKLSKEQKHVKKLQSSWGGFEIPPEVKEEWADWLKKHNAEQDRLKQQNKEPGAIDDTDGPGSSWPDDWKGVGKGHEGFPPMKVPPWGYKAKNTGLPAFCYTAPDKGNCEGYADNPQKRWAYNPFLEECREFDYIGCRGNRNNFREKLSCTNTCTNPEHGGCNLETDFPEEGNQFVEERVPLEFRTPIRRCGYEPDV